MKIKCRIQLVLSLASAMSLFAASTALPGQAAEITETNTQTTSQIISPTSSQTTTEIVVPAISEPKVIDSWMQPSVTRTKSVTSSDGSVEKTVEPMIMERHEAVVVPTEAKVTTTTSVTPAQVTQVTNSAAVKTAVVKTAVVRKAPVVTKKRYVKRAYRRTPRRQQVAVRHTAQTKTVVVRPQIIQQRQTIEQKSVLITRPDPALKFN
ncbi:hypothetical protein KBI23_01180 [bacterium]|nr:hypothetical protein [bacterium]MBP9808881.1 hypothetical protein [bacterium]